MILVVFLCLLFFSKPLTNCAIWLGTIQHSKNSGNVPKDRSNLSILWELLIGEKAQKPLPHQIWHVVRQFVSVSVRTWTGHCYDAIFSKT